MCFQKEGGQEGPRKKDKKSVPQLWEKWPLVASPGKVALEVMWKTGVEEVKTMNGQLSKKPDWKERKRKRTDARRRSED